MKIVRSLIIRRLQIFAYRNLLFARRQLFFSLVPALLIFSSPRLQYELLPKIEIESNFLTHFAFARVLIRHSLLRRCKDDSNERAL